MKEPGDFAKFLSCEQKEKVACSSNKGRVLEDTRGHVYYFKRTINKKNKFGKVQLSTNTIARLLYFDYYNYN